MRTTVNNTACVLPTATAGARDFPMIYKQAFWFSRRTQFRVHMVKPALTVQNRRAMVRPVVRSNVWVDMIPCGAFLLLFLSSGITEAFAFVKLSTPPKCDVLHHATSVLSRSSSRSTSSRAAGERHAAVLAETGASTTTASMATSGVGEIMAADVSFSCTRL